MNLPRMLDKAGAVATLGAALSCTACFPALAGLATALGLGSLGLESLGLVRYLPWLAGLVLLSNLLAFRSHRVWHRLLAGLVGPLMIIGALEVPALAAWRDWLFYPGLVVMLAVSVWDLVSPPGGRACRDCEVSPNV